MQTEKCTRCRNHNVLEHNEELIGVLTAISIVSARLARNLAALERKVTTKSRGDKPYDTRQSCSVRE